MRVGLAGARPPSVHGAVERHHEDPDLVINARYDPATSYGNAQVAEKRLGNAVLLTMDGWGHPSYQVPSECIDKWQGPLPRRSRHPTTRHGLPARETPFP